MRSIPMTPRHPDEIPSLTPEAVERVSGEGVQRLSRAVSSVGKQHLDANFSENPAIGLQQFAVGVEVLTHRDCEC